MKNGGPNEALLVPCWEGGSGFSLAGVCFLRKFFIGCNGSPLFSHIQGERNRVCRVVDF